NQVMSEYYEGVGIFHQKSVPRTPQQNRVVVFVGTSEPFIMSPGQLKSGLAPTDKELEMLFQPMFDEYLQQSRVNEPVPSATEINAQVVPPGHKT
ncbi:hypothetical protein Tco_0388059, partial [Tanacetum coccineum]